MRIVNKLIIITVILTAFAQMGYSIEEGKPKIFDKIDTTLINHSKQFSAEDTSKIYTCSMHPEVISDKPGKCPKCGMDLNVKGSGRGMGMGMMHGKHKVWMYIAGGTMMVVMMTVMIFRYR